ncbi:MAG: GTPase [Alphaproteobacteria bacterium]|nr:GTPase [Alphaproteobacteria bacterium]MCB9974124.1 GTPase [Rhodospirillales bacterium]
MRLKTFTAQTMTEAMQMVRKALGEEAIIVATKEDPGSKNVSVTAAVEPAFEIGPRGLREKEDWLQYDREDEIGAVTEKLTEAMLRHAVPDEIIDHVVSCATVMGLEEPGIALISVIEHLFTFRPLPVASLKKPVMMVGPPGSGKTLAVAKLAARGTMNGLDIGVISTDTVRAGGVEQLEAFTRLLEIPLRKARTLSELKATVDEMVETKDQIVIDTSGLNPFNIEDVKVLAKQIVTVQARPVLALPGGIDADESGEMARVFATIGVSDVLPTRIDIARRLGGILAAAHHGALCLSDYSHSPMVSQGLASLSPKTLSRLLMPSAYREKRTRRIIKATQTSGKRT